MRILLLNPPGEGYNHLRDYYCSGIAKSSYYYHPVDLLYLSGTLAQEHEVRVIDAIARQWSRPRTLDFLRETGYDAIVSLVSAPTFHLDHPFLGEVHRRMPSCRIIGTGDVYREMRESMFDRQPYLEACLTDFSTQDLLRYLRGPNGRPVANVIYRGGRGTVAGAEVHHRGTFSIPSPRWEEFPKDLYSLPIARRGPFMTVLTDFGCPYQCVYCPISTIHFKTRPLEEVIGELEALRGLGYREIHFRDQTFAVDKARTLKLCARLEKEWPDLSWTCFSRVDVMDEERARAMKRAGCHTIIFGVEFERESLYRDMRKNITRGQLFKTVEMCRRLGLRAAGEFIVGLPDQGPEDILATGEMARRLRLDFASFNLAMPRMATSWRRELIASGRADEREWRDDTLRGSRSWVHPRLTLPELRRLCRRIERRFYFAPSYLLRRLLEIRTWTQAKLIARNGLGLLMKSQGNVPWRGSDGRGRLRIGGVFARAALSAVGAALAAAIVWVAAGLRAGPPRAPSEEAFVRSEEGPSPARGARGSGAESQSEDWRGVLARARTFQDGGDIKGAVRTIEKALAHQGRRGPAAWPAYRDLAHYYLALGLYDKAKSTLEKAKRSERNKIQAYIREGYAGMSAGRDDEARRSFEAAVALDTGNPLGYFHMGAYMQSRGQLAESERLYKKALKIFKSSSGKYGLAVYVDLLAHLQAVLVRMGRLEEAEAMAREGIAKSGRDRDMQLLFYSALAEISAARGQTALAEKYYRRAADACRQPPGCDPGTQLESQINLARSYMRQGRRADAMRLAKKLQKLATEARKNSEGPSFAVREMADLWSDLGETAKAERMYRSIIRYYAGMPRAPGLAQAQSGLARLYCKEGKEREAAALYGEAGLIFNGCSAAKGEDWRGPLGRAHILERSGQTKEAIRILEDALARRGRSGGWTASVTGTIYVELARDYLALGRYEKARLIFERAKRLAPNNFHAYIQGGYAGMIAGDNDESRRSFEAAIALDTGNPEGYVHMGKYLSEARGEYAEAETYYRKARRIFKSDPGKYKATRYMHLLSCLGDLLVRTGRLDEAEPLLREGIAHKRNGDPDMPTTRAWLWGNLAQLSEQRGRISLAEKYFRRAMESCGRPPGCDGLVKEASEVRAASFYVRQGRWVDARRLAEKLQKQVTALSRIQDQGPGFDEGMVGLADIWLHLGETSKAEQLYRTIIKDFDGMPRAPELGEAELGLARLYCKEGRAGKAKEWYGKSRLIFEAYRLPKQLREAQQGCRRSNGTP